MQWIIKLYFDSTKITHPTVLFTTYYILMLPYYSIESKRQLVDVPVEFRQR